MSKDYKSTPKCTSPLHFVSGAVEHDVQAF